MAVDNCYTVPQRCNDIRLAQAFRSCLQEVKDEH